MDRHDDEHGAVDMPGIGTPPLDREPIRDRKPAGLKAAVRRARVENADRTDVVTDLRGAELTRLEILREHLGPVFDEVPADCDIFDPGIAPGDKPRLFIDMVAFVEMGRDRRTYRFLQDTRAGRVVLSESERIETAVRAVTEYIARRLIEREKALATFDAPQSLATAPSRQDVPAASTPRARPHPRPAKILARVFLFLVEIVGSAVIFGALAAAAYWAWQTYVK